MTTLHTAKTIKLGLSSLRSLAQARAAQRAGFGTCGRGVKFHVQGRESCFQKWTYVCISECQSTWCTYDALTDEAREDVHGNNLCQLQLSSTGAVPHAVAQQHADVMLSSLLISVPLRDGSYAHIYIQMLAHYQTAVIKISCLTTLGN